MARTRRTALMALVVATLALGATGRGVGVEAADTEPAGERPRYTLGSGDRLDLKVFGQQNLSGEYEVGGNGNISLPLIGDVTVDGMTVNEAEGAVESAYKPDYLVNPRVSIQVMNYRPFYILGEVNSPGSYDYVSGLTVVEAVSIAGGYTYRAATDDVTIVRKSEPTKKVIEVNENTRVLPGDTIRVPERFF